ncbi:Adaptive-response sensory-kinase SasA [wastewater metagenome]|uniref:histidine kinase n=3 Tax=root TaxID=1 RepID=A0A5B8RFP3_9ZZZZ|nr:ATP-binding protein [Arhodomonas aquaeolei]QEA05507.1 adaptive-response sensory-kinase SasA [uncultured organism]
MAVTASLHRRLLVTAGIVTVAFTLLAATGLEQAFRRSAIAAERDRLRGQVHTLLAAMRVGEKGIRPGASLPEPRFARPGSGLYAWVLTPEGGQVWHSRSAIGQSLPAPEWVTPGTVRFRHSDGRFRMDYGVSWEPLSGPTRRFSITLIAGDEAYRASIAGFRRTLWAWMSVGCAGLLLALWLTLRWGLAPLRRVTAEVDAMHRGWRDRLGGHHPREIAVLTDNINRLADGERERTRRYRETLDNLAHSLKTPLAVIRGALASRTPADLDAAAEQITRIDRQIEYHVRRSGAGRLEGGGRTAVAPVIHRLARALHHARLERDVELQVHCPDGLWYAGTEDDLMEMLGNILDNAWRYGAGHVAVTAADDGGGRRIRIDVDDNGPGIAADVREAALTRGRRLDTGGDGQGIGLAVVRELAGQAGGTLALDGAPELGGTRVTLILPGGEDG